MRKIGDSVSMSPLGDTVVILYTCCETTCYKDHVVSIVDLLFYE